MNIFIIVSPSINQSKAILRKLAVHLTYGRWTELPYYLSYITSDAQFIAVPIGNGTVLHNVEGEVFLCHPEGIPKEILDKL